MTDSGREKPHRRWSSDAGRAKILLYKIKDKCQMLLPSMDHQSTQMLLSVEKLKVVSYSETQVVIPSFKNAVYELSS